MKHLTAPSLAAQGCALVFPMLFGRRRKRDFQIRISDARQLSPCAIAELRLTHAGGTPVCRVRLVGTRDFFNAAVGKDASELYQTLLARCRRHAEAERHPAPSASPSAGPADDPATWRAPLH